MKKFVSVFVFIAIICLNSCTLNQQKKSPYEQHAYEDYIFPDTIFSFYKDYFNEELKPFITVTNASDTELPYFAEEFVITYLVKGFLCEDADWLMHIKERLLENGSFRIKSAENNYFIIGSERELLHSYDTTNLKEKYAYHINAPLVLNFHEVINKRDNLYDKITLCGLPGDYEIFVIKSGNKYVLPEKYRYEWEILPEKIRHGYSSGMAFSKDKLYVYFWVVAW